MKLSFWGAARVVTGSCHRLTACSKNILIDCGLQQGGDVYNENELFFDATAIDAVCVTHAHTDHSGRLPLMVKNGYKGPIYATRATCDLLKIMLLDSARIQESDAQWKAKKNKRSGDPTEDALYTVQDATDTLELLVPVSYGDHVELFPGIAADWYDAGHLLGSAAIRFTVTEGAETRTVIFSGDIGNVDKPIIRDPQPVPPADYVVMESTYGDRSHGPKPDYVKELAAIMQRTFDRGGNLVIPSFAVGRTQEMLYFIRKIKEDHLVKNHDGFQVFVDSPLALEATTIFQKHMWDDYDEEAMELVKKGINPIGFDGLRTSVTSDDSKNINFDPNPKVILSASGMCEAGRIKHHLKHNLWRPESTVLFVGYQAVGTLGRSIIEGADKVKLFGEEIEVRAEICKLNGISGHADREGLLEWLGAFEKKPEKVFVVHGDDSVIDGFAKLIHETFGLDAQAPYSGSVFDLKNGCWEKEEAPVRIKKPETRAQDAIQGLKANTPFARLLAAGQRLLTVIRHNEGGANKDLARFTSQINSLCDKWDR